MNQELLLKNSKDLEQLKQQLIQKTSTQLRAEQYTRIYKQLYSYKSLNNFKQNLKNNLLYGHKNSYLNCGLMMSNMNTGAYRDVADVFDPTTVAGLIQWQKSSDGITKDSSDFVSDWADQSGNSNDVTQSTGSKQPLWVDSIYNSLPTIRFDGSNDRLFNSTFSGGAESQPNTIFIAAEFPTINDDFVFDGVTTRHAWFRTGNNYTLYAGSVGNAGTSAGTFAQFTLTFNTTSSSIRRNASTLGTGFNPGSSTFNGISLGATGADTQFADVDISEILIYDSEITGTDLTNIETYLISRYAL